MANGAAINFVMKEGDVLPRLRLLLRDEQNQPVVLTGASVTLQIQNRDTGDLLSPVSMTLDADTTNGYVNYYWAEGNEAGVYNCVVIVTYANLKVQTFPTDGYFVMEVQSRQTPSAIISDDGDELDDTPYFSLLITAPQSGDVLTWNGTKWVNASPQYWRSFLLS
jgi:hypothetical protein